MSALAFSFIADSWTEYLTAAEAPTPRGVKALSRDNDDSWAGGSWDEAVKLAHDGWHDALPETDAYARRVAYEVTGDKLQHGWEFPRDVTGEAVDVAAYLTGEPECMVNPVSIDTQRVGGVVRLIVPINYNYRVPQELARKRGAAVVALVDVLRRAGNTLEIWAAINQQGHGSRVLWGVKVQAATDPVDIGRIMYVLGHPMALRRTSFGIMETQTPAKLRGPMGIPMTDGDSGGYGSPLPASVDDFPEVDGPTITLPMLEPRDDWSEDSAVKWIESALDTLTVTE